MALNVHPKVWLITGCSSGFGREFALGALQHGDRVVATARDVSKLEDLREKGAKTFALDVCSTQEEIDGVVAAAVQTVGAIDILVNNAGYFLIGGVEECDDAEVRSLFDTNVFGLLKVQRAVLPHMRARKEGVIANIGSISGWGTSAGTGLYSATKFAVAALSMALKAEVAHLGIEVVCVEPGMFRTSVLGERKAQPVRQIDELSPATGPTKKYFVESDGRQSGDPAKAAKLLVELLTKSGRFAATPLPARLLLGRDAAQSAQFALERGQKELDQWEYVAVSTDFDDP